MSLCREEILLEKYLPQETVSDVLYFLKKHKVSFKITSARKTKLGDYRCPQGKYANHKITINGNLSKFAFLLVSLHEFAHLNVWLQHKNKVNPHGEEWKNEFKHFVNYYIAKNIFPPDLSIVLQKHMQNPSASIVADKNVVTVLQKYNPKNLESGKVFLSELEMGQGFELSKKKFVLLEKIRTRYKCKSIENNKLYLVSSNALVKPVKVIESKG